MRRKVTCTEARSKLASLCNKAVASGKPIIITRRSHEDVALIAASELSSLVETLHLFRSPKNAARLMTALNRAMSRYTASNGD